MVRATGALAGSQKSGGGRMSDVVQFIKVTVTFERREDGGLRAYSEDAPGLHLSGPDPELVFRDVIPALETLFEHNESLFVRFGPVTAARASLEADGLLPMKEDREEREYVAPLEAA